MFNRSLFWFLVTGVLLLGMTGAVHATCVPVGSHTKCAFQLPSVQAKPTCVAPVVCAKKASRYLLWGLFVQLELYLIHRLQHVFKGRYGRSHKVHHRNYKPKEIVAKTRYEKGLLGSLDQYFYTTVFIVMPLNSYCYKQDRMLYLYTAGLGLLEFYLHDQYHTEDSFLERFKWFRWLRDQHQRHHMYPGTNFFLVNPFFDWLFGTYHKPKLRL